MKKQPLKAKIPTREAQINLRYIVISMLSAKVDSNTFRSVAQYLLRKEWDSFRSLRRVFLENVKQLKPQLLNEYPELIVELIG